MVSPDLKKQLLEYQRNEITEYHIYRRLARIQKFHENRRILERIAEDEKGTTINGSATAARMRKWTGLRSGNSTGSLGFSVSPSGRS